MPSYTYTAQQLLDLRDCGIPMPLSNVPERGVNHALQSGSIGRQIGGESRTLGRFHKFKAFHTQQPSAPRPKIDFPAPPEEVAFVRQQSRREAASSMSTEMEWRYRGRAGSEATASAEPLSAPTGINAQQSEGFQRFYKAVISPSHVRVTAGGRIVPNTRGTSPVSKRLKDKEDEGGHSKDGTQQTNDHTQQALEGAYLAAPRTSNMPAFAFPPHPFYPPFHTPLPSMPMMPLPMGLGLPAGLPGGFSFSHQPGPPNSVLPFIPPELLKASAKENLLAASFDGSASLKAPVLDKIEEKPRRESSEQFERSKPFLMNGQVVYPAGPPAMPPHLAPGSHPHFPPGFLGHPNYPLSAFHSGLLGPPPVGLNHIFNPSLGFPAMPGSLQASHMAANEAGPMIPANSAVNASSANASQPPSAPPISSIRPSEISRKQIEMLRSSLKYHEDQLMYNRHQIDEKEMEHTIQMLQSQIDRFEVLNQSQLRFEESHYPKKEVKTSEPAGPHPRSSNRGSQSNTSFQGTVKHASSSTRRSDSFRHKQNPRRKEPMFSLNSVDPTLLLTDPVKKSTLPSRAALAPPFEPRSFAGENRTGASRTCGSFQWDGTAVDDGLTASHVTGEGTVRGPGQDRLRLSSSAAAQKANLGKPYLVGTLPAGVDPESAKDTDYIYERELTQDETRSRYLYWGRAPSFTRRGLPRFDGKNFYPASPREEINRNSSPPPLLSRRVPIGDPSVDFYTGAFQPKDAGVPGQYASNFRRERQKPVKVTLRRPDPDTSVKARSAIDNCSKSTVEPVRNITKSSKQDTVQPDNTRTKFLHTVLKRNISANSEVLPGALTSATVQGVLPQYSTGYESLVAASLSSNNTSPVAMGRLSPIKSDDGSSIFITPASNKVGENRPPPDSVGTASLEQQFQSMTHLDNRHDSVLPAHWSGL